MTDEMGNYNRGLSKLPPNNGGREALNCFVQEQLPDEKNVAILCGDALFLAVKTENSVK